MFWPFCRRIRFISDSDIRRTPGLFPGNFRPFFRLPTAFSDWGTFLLLTDIHSFQFHSLLIDCFIPGQALRLVKMQGILFHCIKILFGKVFPRQVAPGSFPCLRANDLRRLIFPDKRQIGLSIPSDKPL